VEESENLAVYKQAVEARIDDMETSVESIKIDVKAMREIIETWNNGKGFVNTVRVLSKIVIFLSLTGAALTGIYQSIKHFGD